MRAEDRKPSKRVFPLLQNLDLDTVTFAQVQGTGNPITIEDMNEQEMIDLVIVNLARLCVAGEWDGLLEAGGGVGGSITDNQIAFGATTANTIEGEAQLTWLTADDTLQIGLGAGYPRLALAGVNGFLNFTDTTTPTPALKGQFGMSGSSMYFKQTASAVDVFQIHSSGAWGLMGANYGDDGQVLTSQGSGYGVGWEDAALSTSAHASAPSAAGDTGTTGQLAYDADYFYVCIATDTWKRTALSTW